MSDNGYLGHGSYGEVRIKDGKAIKKFTKTSHLIQEYMALQYLNDCQYVVHSKGVDFDNLELHMELYDCSLSKWWNMKRNNISHDDLLKIFHDIIMGLVELHDRNLSHGDLKPSNILIRKEPLRAVLGDCGFVSNFKYTKIERTADVYRDPIINHDHGHDLYSLGICMLELFGQIKIGRKAKYSELKVLVDKHVENFNGIEFRKIIYNLLHSDRSRRPSARSLLNLIYKKDPIKWVRPSVLIGNSSSSSSSSDHKDLRHFMKHKCDEFKIKRGKKCYYGLITYINNHDIKPSQHKLYAAVTLMIASAIFGSSGFRESQVQQVLGLYYSVKVIYSVLMDLLNNQTYIQVLLAPY